MEIAVLSTGLCILMDEELKVKIVSELKRKQISALIIDDETLTEKPPESIDFLQCYSNGDGSLVSAGESASIRRWQYHCEDVFRHKEIEFDLLSIDIRFSADISDPENYFSKRNHSNTDVQSFNINGLYHGLMSMARRKQTDDFGNVMPLAWEIRTASPMIADQADLKPELARVMGFFYAMAGVRRNNQSFENYIRELVGPKSGENLCENLLQYFRDNGGLPGKGVGVTARLMPDWRKEFKKSVKDGLVSIDMGALQKHRSKFSTLLASNMSFNDILNSNYASIPIADDKGYSQYLIPLRSIFSDRFKRRKIDKLKENSVAAELATFMDSVLNLSPETPRAYLNLVSRATSHNKHLFLNQSNLYSGPIWNKSEHEVNAFSFIGYLLLKHVAVRNFGSRARVNISNYPEFFDHNLDDDETIERNDKHHDNWLRRALEKSKYFFDKSADVKGMKGIKSHLIDPLKQGKAAFGDPQIGIAFHLFLNEMGLTDNEIVKALSGMNHYKPR